MVLSNSPTVKADLVVTVIWGKDNQLGFSRPGDDSWTEMASWDGTFSDIIYHNGMLYALDVNRRVLEIFEIDLKGGSHEEVENLGNKALFLGHDASFCIELSTWNEIKPNCIFG
ncbi:hypothetical protein BUALT_Bualt10G0050500 [Buddleja alternifolia]|uniref:KIB1-4 beta-propeller domain-containing protein n=1 Tax=Buddleja alternifolia TaxID=168488 RepID=A0AAV6X6X7_9LAMI|nr:hypothetical protein BUALT_Bualt10G0050500 [Buddleja alternifolia]